MKILVPVKRVVDYNVKIKVKSDNSGVDLENVKMAMNPFDEIAVEEAVRLKEKKLCDEITAISIGSAKSEETLRTALAVGVDKGILVETEEEVQPLEVAKILKEVVKKNKTNFKNLIIIVKVCLIRKLDGLYNICRLAGRTFVSKFFIFESTVSTD